MSRNTYRVGVLASTSGSYGAVGKTILNGVCQAAQELRSATGGTVNLELVKAELDGDNAGYFDAAKNMLQSGIKHVVGCYTSSSRKDILPLFEQYEALLWYPARYEGFEGSDNVVYTGAVPNHHIHPLVEFMLLQFGDTAYCIGSDYIWGWESNRVFKDEFGRLGGRVLGESYLPIGNTNMADLVDVILNLKPAFILNTLIGVSSYHFFRELRSECERRGIDQPTMFPVASCSLSEADLKEIGMAAADGHYSSSVYFASIDTPENNAFVNEYVKTYPNESLPTVDAEAAYIATHFLGAALAVAPENDIAAIRHAATKFCLSAPQGQVYLDPISLHSFLTPRIGRSTTNGEFEVLAEAAGPVRPDPYLVGVNADMTWFPSSVGLKAL